jgi:hypothetical protein
MRKILITKFHIMKFSESATSREGYEGIYSGIWLDHDLFRPITITKYALMLQQGPGHPCGLGT